MWPQSGDGLNPVPPPPYGVPGPAHVVDVPSPHDQVIDSDTAVAVTDSPPADAVAECVPHVRAVTSVHAHVGNPTICGTDKIGDNRMTGPRNASIRTARAASTSG